MANFRYNCKVQSGLLAGRRTHFYCYFESDEAAGAFADVIDAVLANGAKLQVSKVIREANVTDPVSSAAVEPKAATMSFMNTADPSKKRASIRVVGMLKATDVGALATTISELTSPMQNQVGDDMDAVVSSDGGINLFSGGTPRKDLSASG